MATTFTGAVARPKHREQPKPIVLTPRGEAVKSALQTIGYVASALFFTAAAAAFLVMVAP